MDLYTHIHTHTHTHIHTRTKTHTQYIELHNICIVLSTLALHILKSYNTVI